MDANLCSLIGYLRPLNAHVTSFVRKQATVVYYMLQQTNQVLVQNHCHHCSFFYHFVYQSFVMITIKTLYIIFYVICFNEFYYYSPVAGKHCMSHLLCIIDTYSDFIYRIKTELKLHNLLIKFEIYVYLLHYSLFSYMVALKILAEHRIQKKMECNLRYVNIVKYLYDRM